MDIFDIDEDVNDGVRLLDAALAAVVPSGATPPDYGRFLPADWRDRAPLRKAVEDRMSALRRVGARLFVERLRLEWRAGPTIPEPSGRLDFRPVRGSDELIELMTIVLQDTLDAHGRDDLTRMSPRQAAQAQYDSELNRFASPREWWQVACLPDGDPVGFVVPAHNGYNAIIAYLGVVPAHRGHGYAEDLVAAGTRLLAAQDVPRIRAATDVGNTPMATAFARAGYVAFERQIDMTWRYFRYVSSRSTVSSNSATSEAMTSATGRTSFIRPTIWPTGIETTSGSSDGVDPVVRLGDEQVLQRHRQRLGRVRPRPRPRSTWSSAAGPACRCRSGCARCRSRWPAGTPSPSRWLLARLRYSSVPSQIEPVHTPWAPSASDAAICRPEPMPPAPSTGTSGPTASTMSGVEHHAGDLAGVPAGLVALRHDDVDAVRDVAERVLRRRRPARPP